MNNTGEITLNRYCEIEQYHEIDWTIEDFFSYTEEDNCYESPTFTTENMEWHFSIYPNGEHEENSIGWVGLYLLEMGSIKSDEDCLPPKSANLNFGVRKADGTVEVIKEGICHVFDQAEICCGEAKFLERSKLMETRSELTPSGTLIVTCKLRMNEGLNFASRLVKLSSDFRKLFLSKKGSDVTLKVQGEEFSVHTVILGSRSSVFEAMFEVDMKEKKMGIVDIDDCRPGSFKDFLVYIYSCRFENSAGDIFELYRIAHKYCVDQLKDLCVLYITRDMSIHNVIDDAILGHQLGEEKLKAKSQIFFEDNVVNILPTDKWKSLLRKDPTLANELLINMAKHMEFRRKEKKK